MGKETFELKEAVFGVEPFNERGIVTKINDKGKEFFSLWDIAPGLGFYSFSKTSDGILFKKM
ncbi:MAG: hypothetical protein ACLFQV_07560 [Vulcanimicrobiota bacterium]